MFSQRERFYNWLSLCRNFSINDGEETTKADGWHSAQSWNKFNKIHEIIKQIFTSFLEILFQFKKQNLLLNYDYDKCFSYLISYAVKSWLEE